MEAISKLSILSLWLSVFIAVVEGYSSLEMYNERFTCTWRTTTKPTKIGNKTLTGGESFEIGY